MGTSAVLHSREVGKENESSRCVASLKFNVRSCGDLVNAFIEKTSKKGAFTSSVDPGETRRLIRSCAICHVKHVLVTVDNTISYNESGHLSLFLSR